MSVQSVDRALALVEVLAARDGASLGELAAATGLTPSTAHRLLATLVERGFAARGATAGSYVLGPRAAALGARAAGRYARLRALARPHLELIRGRTGETTNLAVLDGAQIVYVDQAEGSRSMRMFTEIGRAVAAHTTGAGKAMLAFDPAGEDVGRLSLELFPARRTATTLATPEELAADLARTRVRGYAIDGQEQEEGVVCVAAPVVDAAGRARVAISVSGPAERMERRLEELGALLREETGALADALAGAEV